MVWSASRRIHDSPLRQNTRYLNVFVHPEEGEYALDGKLWWDPDDPEAPCFGDTEMWDSYPEHRANLVALASGAVERREAALRRCRAIRLS
jgi:hypothetical protein